MSRLLLTLALLLPGLAVAQEAPPEEPAADAPNKDTGGAGLRFGLGDGEEEVIDPELASSDPNATVKGEQHDLQIELIVITTVPGSVLKHHMNLLAGNGWELRDVSKASVNSP